MSVHAPLADNLEFDICLVQVPDTLKSIFVTATFHWDVLRLIHLHQVISAPV